MQLGSRASRPRRQAVKVAPVRSPAARIVQSSARCRYFTTYRSPSITTRSSRAPDLPAPSTIGLRSDAPVSRASAETATGMASVVPRSTAPCAVTVSGPLASDIAASDIVASWLLQPWNHHRATHALQQACSGGTSVTVPASSPTAETAGDRSGTGVQVGERLSGRALEILAIPPDQVEVAVGQVVEALADTGARCERGE